MLSFSLFFFVFVWFLVFFFFSQNFFRISGFFSFCVFFLSSFFAVLVFNKSLFWYQIILKLYTLPFLNISYILGFDGISVFLLILCCFLLLLCFLFCWYLKYKIKWYVFFLFFTLWLLLNVFLSLDLFLFFFFFETIIVPLFFLIGIWGSRSRKIYASYQFFIYTLLGSIFMILSIYSIYFSKGSSSFDIFLHSQFFCERQWSLWFCFFLGFSVKIPILPFHIWLPEAHVEAPTPGSVILAGIVLKLGTYAILRFLVNSFGNIAFDFIFVILSIAIFGLTYASMVALNQIDIKKIIAYSSVAHMNFSLVGFFCQNLLGLAGSFYMMLGHAITSSALFFGIGVLYDRFKTRLVFYYGGMVNFMPVFAATYFFFILSNFGFPGSVNFVGEFLISFSIFIISNLFSILSFLGLFLSLLYSLNMYNRLFFGPYPTALRYFSDCIRLEFYILLVLGFLVVFYGFFPNLLLSFSFLSLKKLVFLTVNF